MHDPYIKSLPAETVKCMCVQQNLEVIFLENFYPSSSMWHVKNMYKIMEPNESLLARGYFCEMLKI